MSSEKTEELGEGEGFDDKKAITKDLPLVIDDGVFVHHTGDKYEGTFEARKKDRTARMQGLGTYTTAEGDIYTGTWDNDRLAFGGEAKITYNDGSKFEGMFKDWNYNGRGRYTYPDNSTIMCDFTDSIPSGNLTLIDPNGHIWLGRAESGFGWFEPVNHYYHMLEKMRESKSSKLTPKLTPKLPLKTSTPKSGKRK